LITRHVVASFSLVFLKKDNDIGSATLMGGDTKADKCFLKTSDMKLTPIQGVRTFESVEVGEEVFALGNPKTLELTFSPGIVSAKRRDDGVDFVQTTWIVWRWVVRCPWKSDRYHDVPAEGRGQS
jgi:S1-C subfamily serine protease